MFIVICLIHQVIEGYRVHAEVVLEQAVWLGYCLLATPQTPSPVTSPSETTTIYEGGGTGND